MSLPAVFDPQGKPIRLGELVKSGGAGSVYLCVSHPDSVVKLYHAKVDAQMYARKLQAMLQLCPRLPAQTIGGKKHVQIAWPQQTVYDAKGVFIGFMMPMLDIAATSDLEYMMNERQARDAKLPVSLGARITLAANLTRVLAQLHQRGHHVVDLKPLNLRFYRESLLIALLDCDGFSIHSEREHFPAQQYTPDYLAPEFQGKGVVPAGKEEQQDRFALAVIVFQLMNFGIHPYSGRLKSSRAPTDLPGRIGKYLYAYGEQPSHEITPVPLSAHETWPKALRQMFDRAFAACNTRPSAADWARILERYALRDRGDLQVCGKNRTHQHFAGMPCAACVRDKALSGIKRKQGLAKRLKQLMAAPNKALAAVKQQQGVAKRLRKLMTVPVVVARMVMQRQNNIAWISGSTNQLSESFAVAISVILLLGGAGIFSVLIFHGIVLDALFERGVFFGLFGFCIALPLPLFVMLLVTDSLVKSIPIKSDGQVIKFNLIMAIAFMLSAFWLGGLGFPGAGIFRRGIRAGLIFAGMMVLVDFLYSFWVNKGLKYKAVQFFLTVSAVIWVVFFFVS